MWSGCFCLKWCIEFCTMNSVWVSRFWTCETPAVSGALTRSCQVNRMNEVVLVGTWLGTIWLCAHKRRSVLKLRQSAAQQILSVSGMNCFRGFLNEPWQAWDEGRTTFPSGLASDLLSMWNINHFPGNLWLRKDSGCCRVILQEGKMVCCFMFVPPDVPDVSFLPKN